MLQRVVIRLANHIEAREIKIETDYSTSDREQLKVRIGALLEMAGREC